MEKHNVKNRERLHASQAGMDAETMGRGLFCSNVERLRNATEHHSIRSAGREMPQKITAARLWAEKCHKRSQYSVSEKSHNRSQHSVCRPRNATRDHSRRSAGREMPQEITAAGLQAEKCHNRSQYSVCKPRNPIIDHSIRSANREIP